MLAIVNVNKEKRVFEGYSQCYLFLTLYMLMGSNFTKQTSFFFAINVAVKSLHFHLLLYNRG